LVPEWAALHQEELRNAWLKAKNLEVVEIIISSFEAVISALKMSMFASKTIKSGSEAI